MYHLTNLSSKNFIKHVSKAISVAKEKISKPPIWTPKLLIQHLNSSIPSEESPYESLETHCYPGVASGS